jgi:TolB protein
MKTAAIIITILLVAAVIFLGFIILRYTAFEPQAAEETIEPEPDNNIVEEEPGREIDEEPPAEAEEDKISVIEIYLDGDRDNGIFLGEAVYGVTSPEAFGIYGEYFSETGYLLAVENDKYTFEPGSVHYLYIYALVPESGWDHIREKIIIPGDSGVDENIQLSIDNPSHNEIIKEGDSSNIRISGWSVDFSYRDNTGIEGVEIYLNGPKGFGKFLGNADYGIERQDVAGAFGNANYTNSGYSLYFDGTELEAGSENTLYIYSFSSSGAYNLALRDIVMEGEKKEPEIIMSVEANLNDRSIEISGWAIRQADILEGRPRDPDIEYSIKKIVFTSNQTGYEDLFSINIDGSELTQLTDHPGQDNYPAVSHDGKKIAYTKDINGIWQIMVMDWDGKDKKQITNNPWRSGYPAWSFDGRFIYFEAYIEGSWEIYRMNSDGSNVKQLTFNPGADDWHPYSHPFRYQIIYESGTSRNEKLYIMDYNGKNIDKLPDANMRQRTPAISYDGQTIVFSDNQSIYTMDLNGENLKKISGSLTSCRHPDISPDNKYITFEGNVDGQLEIFIANIDGSDLKRLTNIPGDDYDPYFLYQVD